MTQAPKPNLSEHEEEATLFDDVMRKLLDAKPAPKKKREDGEDIPATEDPES